MIEKSIKDLSLDITEPEYRALGGLSYSLLAKFFRTGDPKVLITPSHETSDALRFGSLVDCLMTEPEMLRERFYITSSKTPSQTMVSVMLYIFKKYPEAKSFSYVPDGLKIEALDVFEYGKSWTKTTRLSRINDNSFYYMLLKESNGKIIMTEEELKEAQACVTILKTHVFTEKFMGDGDPFEEKIERYNQLKFKSKSNGVLIRCMFDRIIVDHNAKTIQPIDLKTSGKKEEKFPLSVLDWNYFIQASMYSQILLDNILKDEYFKDFKILPFKFVVINRFEKTPIVWTYPLEITQGTIVDPQLPLLEKNGYKGWRQLVEEAYWHITNNKFDYSYLTYINRGINTIDLTKYLH